MSVGNTFVRDIELFNGVTLKIHQLEVGDVGGSVWDAALVLIKYLEMGAFWWQGSHLFDGKNVVELGAGTGAVGLAAASYGANVELTDLEEFLPLIRLNADENADRLKGKVSASLLKWGEHVALKEKPSFVIATDCLYYEESVQPLVETLDLICDVNCTVFFSFEDRSEVGKEKIQNLFFDQLQNKFFVDRISYTQLNPDMRSPDIHVYKFVKKNELSPTYSYVGYI